MEQFLVIKTLGKGYQYHVAESFNNVGDAVAYANIMRRKADGWTYSVYQLNEQL